MQVSVITVEGVLTRSDDLRNAMPTKWARTIYDGLRSQTNTIALTRAEPTIAEWWMRRERFNDWSGIISYTPPQDAMVTWEHWRLDKVREFLADGYEIFAFVDHSLDLVEAVRDFGVMGMHIAYPSMAPGLRSEDVAPRAWADIASTVETPA